MQIGARTGSDYVIVSASRESPIGRLWVLDVRCKDDSGRSVILPDVEIRETDIGVLQPSDYCVVKSATGLRALALAALIRRPVATLESVGDVPANQR